MSEISSFVIEFLDNCTPDLLKTNSKTIIRVLNAAETLEMNQAVAPDFWQAVEQFNQGQFYECHDTLEALWMEASEPPRNFYQGILQIAVACYHLGNQNWRGAVILLGEGMSRLQDYSPTYAGIDVDRLVSQSAQFLKDLQQAGPDQVADFAQLVKVDVSSDSSSKDTSHVAGGHGGAVNIATGSGLPIYLTVLQDETS